MTGKADPWLLLVNLGMIWCFGFFFLELLDDFDVGSQQRREALANWTMLTENCAAFRHMHLDTLRVCNSGFRQVPYI